MTEIHKKYNRHVEYKNPRDTRIETRTKIFLEYLSELRNTSHIVSHEYLVVLISLSVVKYIILISSHGKSFNNNGAFWICF